MSTAAASANTTEHGSAPTPDDIDQGPVLVRHDSEAWADSTSSSTTSDGGGRLTCGHFLGAVANLCSATLGAGILALPFALYQAGLIFGGLLLLASGWATAVSIDVLVRACDHFQLATYESIVEKALGRTWRQVVEISILIFCGGTAVAYVIAVGDILERVEHLPGARKKVAMAFVWLISMLPLSCLRRMKSLQCASTVGIASILTLLLAATVHLAVPQDPDDDSVPISWDLLQPFLGPASGGWLAVVRACPLFCFAFSCQVNVCQIYDELPSRNGAEKAKSMRWVTWAAVGVCTLLYASISLVTLMDFGEGVKPNVLSCYSLTSGETLLHVAFVAMAMAVVMAFPLNIFPARTSVIQMCAQKQSHDFSEEAQKPLLGSKTDENNNIIKNSGYNSGDDVEHGDLNDPLRTPPPVHQVSSLSDAARPSLDEPDDDDDDFHAGQHIGVTLLIASLALGLALVIPNISVVFGLLGGTTSSLLGFVVPGMLGLQMDKHDVSSWILVVAGSLIGILTTGVTIYTLLAR
jgi:amino acid permease